LFATTSMALLAGASFSVAFKFVDFVRHRVAFADDGREDVFERCWYTFAVETEDGIFALTCGHLIVQVVRFSITGRLPPSSGAVPPGMHISLDHVVFLFVWSFVFVAIIPAVDLLMPETPSLGRINRVAKRLAATCVSFCHLYAITWWIQGFFNVNGAVGSMIIALLVTFFGFGMLFLLFFLTDLEFTGEIVDREIKTLIQPFAILIGFSWKQAFGAATTSITSREQLAPTPLETLFIAVMLAVVVVPAWRMFILPTIMQSEVGKTEVAAQKEGFFELSKGSEALGELSQPLVEQLKSGEAPREPAEREAAQPEPREEPAKCEAAQPEPREEPPPEAPQPPPPAACPEQKLDASELELQRRNRWLEQRNAQLQASLSGMREELAELQKMAELLV